MRLNVACVFIGAFITCIPLAGLKVAVREGPQGRRTCEAGQAYHAGVPGRLWSPEPVLTACLWGTLRQQEKKGGKHEVFKFTRRSWRESGRMEEGDVERTEPVYWFELSEPSLRSSFFPPSLLSFHFSIFLSFFPLCSPFQERCDTLGSLWLSG